MYVAAYCIDRPDSVDKRMAARPDHLAFLKSLGDTLKLGGALLDDTGETPIGSLVVLEVESVDAAGEIMANDPYAKADLFDSVSLRPWKWFIGNPDTDPF